ncbi:MAG: efflux transporter outer membrane subunit [Pseudorhodoplanes sp.]
MHPLPPTIPRTPSTARRILRTARVAALLPLLSGCFFNDKADLSLDIPATYRDADRRPHRALPEIDWWRGFRSTELTALIEEAQNANLDIAAAMARIVQADAQARIANAPLLPIVDLDLGASQSRSSTAGTSTSGGGAGGGASVSPVRNTFTAALNGSYEIDFWGKNRALLRAAQQTAIASRFDREVIALATMASVANAYFQVLASQDRLRIARDNVASASRVLDIIRQRVEVGTATGLDIAQQESLLATQRATIPVLEQTLRQNTATLAVLIGKPPERVTVRGGSMRALRVPRVTPGIPSELLAQRPDIGEAEALLLGADANVEAARAAFFPSIVLTAEGGYQSAALKSLFQPNAVFYTIASGLTQPIFDNFRLQGQFEQQRGRQDELLQIYRKTVVQAFADVDSALVAVQQSARRERLQREVVTSSRRAFDIAETRLREGTVDLVTVLTTQQTLFQAQDALAQAQLARLQAVVTLYQALGGGWLLQKETRNAP